MASDRAGLIFREDYFDDPAGWAAVKALLVDVFGVDVKPLDRLGGPDRTLMSSAWFDEKRAMRREFFRLFDAARHRRTSGKSGRAAIGRSGAGISRQRPLS
ncbi:hypothetical protein [Mycoplana rhizolycopersici]|uniref:Uncharacterized protein n=1 Tax=Mycoplana rhizolycopersici TaxID=2746702 RepID=A0ABX2QAK2_9HYPH|nr:hypothetical protein [Rhizobium rhizolycopersici]NVP54759.1 hypothetical protein [Rhizobium rhizolycopersici]